MTPRLVLVGPPGAGKTTVGMIIAERWGVGFRDTDLDIEHATGTTIADIFVERGEPHFRDLERTAVRQALDEHDGVLALGGGAVLDPEIRQALQGRPVIFLDVDLTDAVRRVGLARDRPVLLGNPRGMLKALLDARRPVYEAVAEHTVITTGRAPQEVADAVLTALGRIEDR